LLFVFFWFCFLAKSHSVFIFNLEATLISFISASCANRELPWLLLYAFFNFQLTP